MLGTEDDGRKEGGQWQGCSGKERHRSTKRGWSDGTFKDRLIASWGRAVSEGDSGGKRAKGARGSGAPDQTDLSNPRRPHRSTPTRGERGGR
jgi:hypothetical protein